MSINFAHKDHTKALIGMGFMAVFSLMLLVTWLSMSTLQNVNSSMSTLIENTEQKTTRAYRMRDVIRVRSNTMRELIRSRDPLKRHKIFDKLISHTNDYQAARSALLALGANEREQNILDQIDATYDRVAIALSATNRHIYATKQDDTSMDKVLSELELQELVLLNQLNDLVTLEKNLAFEALTANQQTYKETRRLLVLIVIATFAVCMAISGIVITRVGKANQRIAHLANHDDLTGLHNRRSFEQHLQHTINFAERSPNAHGLLYIDLDRFKMVNDTCGHHAGDQLLIQLTQLMNDRLRRGDLFARLGGDEFAIIAQGKSFDDVRKLAEDLRQIVCDFTFHYETQSFTVSLSVGVTPISGEEESMERVLADVDSACYVAKQSGRNRVHITQDNDNDVVQYRNNLAGIQAIRKALAEERLALFYQPIYNVVGHPSAMSHCEILLRIRGENGELYSPTRVIPIAEKYNIMTEIDQWVFNNTIAWLKKTQEDYVAPRLLINLSGHSLADSNFIKYVIEKLNEPDIDADRIAFEISESAIFRNFDHVREFIDRVRALGCELALDDFGAGYSNFSYLKKLCFDYIKIDGTLIRNIATNAMDRNMVSAINQMGHTVGAKTIAEFVEDESVMESLEELQVDLAQGYGLTMPTPLEDLSSHLASRDETNESTGNSSDLDDMDEFKKAS